MTQARARYILNNQRPFNSGFKYAYTRAYAASEPIYMDGITEEEDREIKRFWDRMPSWTCYYDAVMRIARGQGAWEGCGREEASQ